jgi:cell division protein FtsB
MNPIVEYELRQSVWSSLTPTWQSQEEYVVEAWDELVKENKKLHARIKELEQQIERMKKGDK